jgi:hypothetical protein
MCRFHDTRTVETRRVLSGSGALDLALGEELRGKRVKGGIKLVE